MSDKSISQLPDGGLLQNNDKLVIARAGSNYHILGDQIQINLWNDRGNYDASSNVFPSTGGSGPAGAILKYDLWVASSDGTLGGDPVIAGQTIRALVDTPGQTAANWAIGAINTDAVDSVFGRTGIIISEAGDYTASEITNVPAGDITSITVQAALNELDTDKEPVLGFTPEDTANKDASDGYAGLTLFKINFKNVLNTFTSFFTNSNTAARTYTFQNRNGTISDDTDLALKADLDSPIFTGTPEAPTQDPNTGTDLVATCQYVENWMDNLPEASAQITSLDSIPADISGVSKLLVIADVLGNILIETGEVTSTTVGINLNIDYADENILNATAIIESATETNAGLLSAADKAKLNNFQLPNYTTVEKLALTPSAGWMVFDTTLGKACVYSGIAWQTITSI